MPTNAAPPHFAARMAAFYAGYLALPGVLVPFLPVWLAYKGLTPTQIAACVSFPYLVRVFATPIGSTFADRAPNRRFAILLFVALGIFIWLFVDLPSAFVPILILTVAAQTFWSLAMPAADALTLTGVRQFGIDYGHVRLFGSAAFIVANLLSGAALNFLWDDSAIYWMVLGLMCVSIVVSIQLPVTPKAIRALDDLERPRPPSPLRALMAGGPTFVAVLIAAGLIQSSHAQLYSFGSIHWQAQGFTAGQIGILWAVGTGSEIVLFALAGRLFRNVETVWIVAIGGIAAIIRWSLFTLEPGIVGSILLQMLHSLSFGATFIGVQKAITMWIPEETTGGAQGFNVVVTSATLGIGALVSGPLYETLGGHAFLAMVVPAAAGLTLVLLYRPSRRKVA